MDNIQYEILVERLGALVALLIEKGILTRKEAIDWASGVLDTIKEKI